MKIGNSSSAYLPCSLYVILALLLSSCSTCSRQSAIERMQAQMERSLDSLTAVLEGERLRDSIDDARAERLRWQIDSIVAADYNENRTATNYMLYVNKACAEDLDANRKGLIAVVYEETGEIALISTLPGGDIHNQNGMEIEVNGKIYKTGSTDTRPLNRADQHGYTALRDAKGDVMHVDQEISMKMVQAIAADPNSEVTITVYEDGFPFALYTLSDEDKKAIIGSYSLLLMIKELHELEAQDVEFDD